MTPDAYEGDIANPISQKAYMWNGNNPFVYNDPTGFDTIELDARPANVTIFGRKEYHAFIEIYDDLGFLAVRLNAGPSNETNPLFSQLVAKPGSYDARYSVGEGGKDSSGTKSVLLGQCSGLCTAKHGGFDEMKAIENHNALNGRGDTYLITNSNSSARSDCAAGAGAGSCEKAFEKLKVITDGSKGL